MTNQKNINRVAKLKDLLASSPEVVITKYQGLKTQELLELRQTLAAAGGRYTIAKNTLLKIAARGNKQLEKLTENVAGPTAILTNPTNILSAIKELSQYAKQHPKLELLSGLVDDKLVDASELGILATLPTQPELHARLARALTSNQQRLVTSLSCYKVRLLRALRSRSEDFS